MISEPTAMDRKIERRASRWSRPRLLLLAVVIAVALGVTLSSLGRWTGSERSIDREKVRIAAVERGDLIRDVAAEGRVIAAYRPTLTSPARGIVRVRVDPGTLVERGRALVQIESPEIASELAQERSRLSSLEAGLDRQRLLAQQDRLQSREDLGLLEVELAAARRALRRAELVRQQGLINEVEHETAEDDVKVAELKLDLARKRSGFRLEVLGADIRERESQVERQTLLVENLERRVEELTVCAPVDGLVARVEVVDRGSVVAGQPLVTVVDLSELAVEIMIPESLAAEISPGTPARVLSGRREWPGTVQRISPEVEGSLVRGMVVFDGEVPEGLKQNQRMSARLLIETLPGVLKVPRGPFLESGGGRQIYVVEDEVAVRREIETGGLSVSEVEILAGLEEGEQVVLSDQSRFKGADRVLLR